MELAEQARQAIQELLDQGEVELVELACRRQGRQMVLKILVDKPGGISLAECSELNRAIGDRMDERNLIEERYVLEVSSPGLDRLLVTKRDFARHLGKRVRVLFEDPSGAKNTVVGLIQDVWPEQVVIGLADGAHREIPLAKVVKAVLEIRFSR